MSPRRRSSRDVDFALATPSAVALRMLALRFGPIDPVAGPTGLAPFQQEALDRIHAIISARGGALLSDSVGLGKTYVAAALIRLALRAGRAVLVCAPAQLAAHWRRHLRGGRGWTWLSHTSLSRGVDGGFRAHDGLVVVDEAHALRNPATRRYRTLARLCEAADVLLITATPVNNSLRDFYHLVRLFAADDAFADIGVPDLASAVDAATKRGGTGAVKRVAEAVMVRRTRSVVRTRFGEVLLERNGRRLGFPGRQDVVMVRYDLQSTYPRLAGMADALLGLTFPVHALHAGRGAAELLRLGLLKRLESSTAAFRASVDRHQRLVEQFRSAARDGYLLDAREHRSLYGSRECATQIPLHEMLLRKWPHHLDRAVMLRRAAAELRNLRALADAMPREPDDPKVTRLRELLADELRDDAVVIFTEYRDTAVMLWHLLSPTGGVGLVHGGDARLGRGTASRRRVIERFAPVANRVSPPAPHERVTRLIATDVLAEGLNLQDARAVVSYDVPWNPVRLAQRIGRIDRLGSPHTVILACTFLPDRGLDVLLGLVDRVRRKLREIRAVGGDAPRLRNGSVVRAPVPARTAAPVAAEELALHELLRSEYRARVMMETPSPPDRPALPKRCRPVAAAMTWNGDGRAVLCCVTAGTATWLALVRDACRPAVQPPEADRALLAALSCTDGGSPDRDRLRAAVRDAAVAVRRIATRGLAVPAQATNRAAATVHRWLAERPGGPGPAECALADRILAALATPSSVSVELRIARAARRGRPAEDVVRDLERIVNATNARPRRRTEHQTQAVRVRALLELVPDEDLPG
jgi:hypothetical protein